MGCSVREMLERMTSREITERFAYWKIQADETEGRRARSQMMRDIKKKRGR